MIITTTFSIIVKEIYVNSNHIDIIMIIMIIRTVKICPSIQFSQL